MKGRGRQHDAELVQSQLKRAGIETASLLVVAEAIALTFTRAGLINVAATLVIAGAMRYRRGGVDGAVRAIGALATAIVVLVSASRSTESLWLRMTSEGQDAPMIVADCPMPRSEP